MRQGEGCAGDTRALRRLGRLAVEAEPRRLAAPAYHLDLPPVCPREAQRATCRELRGKAHRQALDATGPRRRVAELFLGKQALVESGTVAPLRRLEARNVDPGDADAEDQSTLPRQRCSRSARSFAISFTRLSSGPSTMMRTLGSVPL